MPDILEACHMLLQIIPLAHHIFVRYSGISHIMLLAGRLFMSERRLQELFAIARVIISSQMHG